MSIEIIHSNITLIKADAIVNPANKKLAGSGGCNGMIHKAAGSELLKECKALGSCPKGEAKLTKGYNLPAEHIIHTVGPMYGYENGREAEILTSCYENCFKLAKEMKFKTIAFPCLSTGCFAYPKDEASKVAIGIAKKYSKFFEKIIFVCYEELDYEIYKKLIPAPSQTLVSFQ
ncbi:MAG: macro domain-containing protein [Patescibacteria group bacterium]